MNDDDDYHKNDCGNNFEDNSMNLMMTLMMLVKMNLMIFSSCYIWVDT